MPIYEYQCDKCNKLTSVLTTRIGAKVEVKCRHCNSTNLHRVLSRFATPKSEVARMEALADPSNFADLDENDPKSVARMVRKMGREMGDDLAGPEFDEAADEIEAGGLDASESGSSDDGNL